MRDGDQPALEELLAEDVVAWTDGGLEPGAVRRPVLGVAKVARFLATAGDRLPVAVQGHIAEVNGDAAVVAATGAEVLGVLSPEFGPQGLVGIRAVTDRGRLAFFVRQWDASGQATLRIGP
jgi:RNA polymerase sigma-70 factor (ECF subfamily)